jgi:cleavage and polyadenylation specificity factor subunit 1
MSLYIFTLDLVSRTYPTMTKVDGLPYDCLSLIPCSSALGGVVILTSNAVIHVDQATRRVALSVNGWQSRVSDMPTLHTPVGMRELRLEGARMAFVEERTLFVVLVDGTIVPFEFVVDGKVVSRLVIGNALAQTSSPMVVRKVHGEHLFVGSMVGPSVLLRTASVEEPVTDADDMATSGPAAVVDAGNSMDLDDDDGVISTCIPPSITNESVSQTFMVHQVPTRYPLPRLRHRRRRGPLSIYHCATRFLPMDQSQT